MNSVGNVARVLRLFTPERSVLSVTEVAQLLALPKSSSSRLLKAMAGAGLLVSTDAPSGYGVGNLIFETSRRHRVNSTLSVIADEARWRENRQDDRPHGLCRDPRRHRRSGLANAAGQQAAARGDLARRPAAGLLLVDRTRDAGTT